MGVLRRRSPTRHGAYEPVPPAAGATSARAGGETETFVLTKALILRSLAAVYAVAFVGAYFQNVPLIGAEGLVPAAPYFASLVAENDAQGGTALDGFARSPSIWWWLPLTDRSLEGTAAAGVALSLAACVLACDWMVVWICLWLLYFSHVTAAEPSSFYSYGWESQLLETGFLTIFLCELPRPSTWMGRRAAATGKLPPSRVVLWLFRWLCFRISIGAGLIKVRGGSCWAAHTCLHYHFETQPIPSPTSFIFHFMPKGALSAAVDLDLFVQLYSSWLVLVPGVTKPLRIIRRAGGVIQALFMVNIALSGNYGFLNHLTAIPALAAIDDDCWRGCLRCCSRTPRDAPPPADGWFAEKTAEKTAEITAEAGGVAGSAAGGGVRRFIRRVIDVSLFASIAYLSWPVLANLLQLGGRHQAIKDARRED